MHPPRGLHEAGCGPRLGACGRVPRAGRARTATCLTLATSLMSASSWTNGSRLLSWLRSVRKPSPIFWGIVGGHQVSCCGPTLLGLLPAWGLAPGPQLSHGACLRSHPAPVARGPQALRGRACAPDHSAGGSQSHHNEQPSLPRAMTGPNPGCNPSPPGPHRLSPSPTVPRALHPQPPFLQPSTGQGPPCLPVADTGSGGKLQALRCLGCAFCRLPGPGAPCSCGTGSQCWAQPPPSALQVSAPLPPSRGRHPGRQRHPTPPLSHSLQGRAHRLAPA